MNEPLDPPQRGLATSRLRMCGYAAILVAMAFSQSAGRMVADTKFDLLTNPLKFLSGGLRLWDPSAAFGQIQNQAYGYLWPMGPFFLLGDALHLPEWVVQRLWWALLLCLAFFGIVRLAQRLALGSPLTQVLAGFAFVLTPRITTLLGGTSVEIWPMALAPWVLLPLVAASERGSVRRAAACSALVVACCGGVNAIAVAATLPLGVIWILTRAGGPRKWRLLGWWTLFTALATLWWSLPLLVMGRYSPPFLDYIENATITSVPTGLARTLVGTSDWVAYFAGVDYTAGQQIVTTPFLILDAAAIAALGLVGICLRSNPHQRFLTLGVLVGLALVGFGYSGELAGFLASDRTGWLDQQLAPLRNLHKFDVVLRIPLVLGLAHLMAVLPALIRDRGSRAGLLVIRVATVLALLSLALPWAQDNIAPRGGVVAVPGYWTDVADYLHETDDGMVSLEVPASSFGIYSWGNTHDDVLQGLAQSPWAVRNVIPLAQPGNVVFLDAVTRFLESGHPSRAFATFLADNGVGRLVVRNDLDRFQTGAPDPSYVAALLAQAPGITLAKSFGPKIGTKVPTKVPGTDTRVIEGYGLSMPVGSVDVYDVAGATSAYLTRDVRALTGDPSSGLDPTVADTGAGQLMLSSDISDKVGADLGVTGQVLTDDLRRRESNFAAVRWNESATMPAHSRYLLPGPEHTHRVVADQDRWQTTEGWLGASSVSASTSQSDANAIPPLEIGSHPGAALDGDPATAWRSARHLDPTGQFWEVDFPSSVDLGVVTVSLAADSAPVDRLAFSDGGASVDAPAPDPGSSRSYLTRLGSGSFLRITAAGRDLSLPGSFAISEVRIKDQFPQRYLSLPAPDPRYPVDVVSLTRDPDRSACLTVGDSYPCVRALSASGEDGDTLARQFQVTHTDSYALSGTVSLRRSIDTQPFFDTGVVASSDAGAPYDVAAGPMAMVDGDPGTTWVARNDDETVTIQFPQPRLLGKFRAHVSAAAGASQPTRIKVTAAGRSRTVVLDAKGHGTLPHWTTSKLQLQVVDTDPAFLVVGQRFVTAPPGISTLTFGGQRKNLAARTAATQRRSFGCGSGPTITLDRRTFVTEVVASTSDLMRGQAVPFRVCGSEDSILTGGTSHLLLAAPTSMFRVDTLDLTRDGAASAATQPLTLTRGDHGRPTSVRVPERSRSTLLTLPQNVNAGWHATFDGHELTAVRVAGWKQGFVLPAGAAGTVRLSYPPDRTFGRALVVGALGVVAVLLVLLVPLLRRRTAPVALPALRTGRPGLLDLAVVVVATGLLAGWWGLLAAGVGVAAGLVLRRRFHGWPLLAGLSFLVGTLAMVWDWLTQRSYAVQWTQAWSIAAVGCLVAALTALRTVEGRRALRSVRRRDP